MGVGSGPGAITDDGCAVDVYLLVPAAGEPELIHAAVPDGASLLDLGAGVGRIADPLVALGHHVVAIDDSPDMLAHVRAARPVNGRIEELALPERFDAAIMASHLANVPDQAKRRALFAAARRHLVPHGTVIAQWHPPTWFDTLRPGRTAPSRIGPVTSTLDVHSVTDGLLDATVTYATDDARWTQTFLARRLSPDELDADLAACGLTRTRYLTADHSWFQATAT